MPFAQMAQIIYATGKEKIVQIAPAPLEPCRQALSSFGHDLELHGTAGLLLDHDRTIANAYATAAITDSEFDEVAAA